MFNKKLKNKIAYLEIEIDQIKRVAESHWDWICAIKKTYSSDRQDLNQVIAKLNKLNKEKVSKTKTKGKK